LLNFKHIGINVKVSYTVLNVWLK